MKTVRGTMLVKIKGLDYMALSPSSIYISFVV